MVVLNLITSMDFYLDALLSLVVREQDFYLHFFSAARLLYAASSYHHFVLLSHSIVYNKSELVRSREDSTSATHTHTLAPTKQWENVIQIQRFFFHSSHFRFHFTLFHFFCRLSRASPCSDRTTGDNSEEKCLNWRTQEKSKRRMNGRMKRERPKLIEYNIWM